MRRIVSLWLPRWPTDCLRRATPSAAEASGHEARPLALAASGQGGLRLVAVDDRAAAEGLAPGLLATDARAIVPHLDIRPADPEGAARALGRLADWATRWTPLVALDGTDGLWLDVTGAAHLFGGERALLDDLLARLARAGISARAALAPTPGAAHALARFVAGAPIVEEGRAVEALRPLPVAALRLPAPAREGLERLGVRTIADLMRLSRGALDRRFGPVPMRQLERALGRAPEPITPLKPPLDWLVRLPFAEPLGTQAALEAALAEAARTLCGLLVAEGRGATRLDLALYRSDGTVIRTHIGAARPSRDPAHLARLLIERLAQAPDGLDVGLGLDLLVLAAAETAPFEGVQSRLDGEDVEGAAIADLVDRLATRLGPGRVGRLVPVESHMPERAQAFVGALERRVAEADMPWLDDLPRPLRLLPQPEPVEVMASLPDGPPALFRWRRVPYRIVRAEGPERLAPEWWRRDGRTRDYYRVEDSDGRRFWLYRAGLYDDREPSPEWYLHGFFA
jgi:protein ImuB